MARNESLPALSEKGLLTPDNCVVTLIDPQPQMLFGVANFDRQAVINNNVALAKAARVFGVPVVLSSVETKGFSGNTWPQLLAAHGNPAPIERTSDIVRTHCGAYGVGVEYAYTMVHGAAPTKFPEYVIPSSVSHE